jgi:enterochelin esterase family protein
VEKVGTNTPVDENTIFAIGSAAKAFTATLVAMLVSEGKMDFDGKVSQYLPDFRLFDPYASAEVTIRDALAHRTSLPRADLLWYGSTFSRSEILHRFRYNEPDQSFRSRFVYNNVMVMAAGEAAARVAGSPWDALVSTRIFAPLHMTSSTTSIRSLAGNEKFASPHMAGAEGAVAIDPVNVDNIGPAGSINSTASDMAQWLRFQLGGGVYGGKRFVGEDAFRELQTPQMVRVGKPKQDSTGVFNTYGMGWFIERYRGEVLLQHGGEIDGFTAMVAMLPERHVGVVVLSNSGSSIIPTVVMHYVFDHQLGVERDWLAEATPPKRERAGSQAGDGAAATRADPPARIASYAGRYSNRMYGDMTVSVAGERLHLTREGGLWSGDLEYLNATNFRWLMRGGTGPVITFDVAPDGSVGGLALRMGPEKIEYRRARNAREETDSVALASPRLRELRDAVSRGDRSAEAKFWGEVKRDGAPLVEPVAGDTSKLLVTFLYHGDSTTRNVLLFRGIKVSENLSDNPLARLAGTDVWYRSYPVRRDARFTYLIGENIDLSGGPRALMQQLSGFTTDPLNPVRDPAVGDPVPKQPPPFYVHSAVDLPGAPAQPWIEKRPGVPEGKVEHTTFTSALMHNERDISIYTPAGYSREKGPYDLVIVFDGDWYLTLVPTPTILDNLIAARKIRPAVAVFVDNPGRSRGSELHCNRTFFDFLANELVPWLHDRYAITLDPARTLVTGSSAGGLASSCAALFHPEHFGNVLSQSGAYWWAPQGEKPEWAARQFAERPKLPVRFYLNAGLLEATTSILPENRRFRDVLLSKGYEVHYSEFNGGHEYRNWRGTLADGLITLLGNGAP